MKETPILFKPPMIEAILAGKKTQTRRLLPAAKVKCIFCYGHGHEAVEKTNDVGGYDNTYDYSKPCRCRINQNRFGDVGDHLWVKEAWAKERHVEDPDEGPLHILKREWAGELEIIEPELDDKAWRSPLFMPKFLADIWLEITKIRVERLQDISEEDAEAEGVTLYYDDPNRVDRRCPKYREGFHTLWDSINGKKGPRWSVNPWIRVIEFRLLSKKRAEQ